MRFLKFCFFLQFKVEFKKREFYRFLKKKSYSYEYFNSYQKLYKSIHLLIMSTFYVYCIDCMQLNFIDKKTVFEIN